MKKITALLSTSILVSTLFTVQTFAVQATGENIHYGSQSMKSILEDSAVISSTSLLVSGKKDISQSSASSTTSDANILEFDSMQELMSAYESLLNSDIYDIVQPLVKYSKVQANAQTSLASNNPSFANQWYLQNSAAGIGLTEGWGAVGQKTGVPCTPSNLACAGSSNIKVAVIDSGVNTSAPDLQGANIDQANSLRFYYNSDGTCPVANNQVQAYAYYTIQKPDGSQESINFCRSIGDQFDDDGHGTSVAGVIAMQNNTIGGIGVAPNATILPIALHGDLSFNSLLVGDSIEYAVEQGADIINLSIASPITDAYIDRKIQNALNAGVIIVASAGNCGNKTALTCGIGSDNSVVNPRIFPAASEGVIGVGAVNYAANIAGVTKASYSSFGDYVDYVMPVGDPSVQPFGVTSVNKDGNIQNGFIGTSYASPLMAGYIATLWDSNLGFSNGEVISRLLPLLTEDLYEPGIDEFTGRGLPKLNRLPNVINQESFVLDNPETNSPVSISNFNNRFVSVVRGLQNEIFVAQADTPELLENASWTRVPGDTLGGASQIEFNEQLYQFLRGSDDRIYYRSSTDGLTYSPWNFIPYGFTTNDIALAPDGDRLRVTVRGTDNRVWYTFFNGQTFTNWTFIPNGATDATPSTINYNGKVVTSVKGTDQGIYLYNSTDNPTWNRVPNGLTPDTPGLFIDSQGFLGVVVRGVDNNLWYTVYNGVNYNSWNRYPDIVTAINPSTVDNGSIRYTVYVDLNGKVNLISLPY